MSKLPEAHRFTDLSDYGRSLAVIIAKSLRHTSVTPIQVTVWFIISGLLAVVCMIYDYMIAAAVCLVVKSILDAADGELSRVKNTPSYTGRYFDSIADIILNFVFVYTIGYITGSPLWLVVIAFVGIQLQGTLYNYYYVILRNSVAGDVTSRIFEDQPPIAMPGESQRSVNAFFKTFRILYIVFDKTIYYMDRSAIDSKPFPPWFMTMVSSLGLGSQLLIMGIMLAMGLEQYVLPFFGCYTLLVVVFIGLRRAFLAGDSVDVT